VTTIAFDARLAPNVPAEHEWLYLVNETYVGERCIIPLLVELLDAPVESPAFRTMLERQIGEEREHEALYHRLLGHEPLPGSRYDVEFSRLVRALPSPTLRLFALQVLLEAIGVAAFEYRLDVLRASPSDHVDRRILGDEKRHTMFSYGFFRPLIALDGAVAEERFHAVARQVNALFARHFSGGAVAEVLRETFGDRVDAAAIDASAAMKRFGWKSASTIVAHKNDYLGRYRVAARRD
jgi:hypothetical protein